MTIPCPNCGKVARSGAQFCSACGTSLTFSVQPLQAGQLLKNGNYRIVRPLSKGGMGAIYLAENLQTFGRLCVVKEMLDYFDPTDPQQVTNARQRFEEEASILSRLHHPGIPSIFDYQTEAGHNYIVMDYVEGENLEQMLGRQLPPQQIVLYGIQVCDILEYLAGLSPPVVHHDIKPANIIVEKVSGMAWLVDFGTAKARLSRQPGGRVGLQKSDIYGTEGYAPPEQYKGTSDPRSDVYALAATLYHLLTGDDPANHRFQFPQLASLPGALSRALAGALKQDVRQRSDATEFAGTLEAAARSLTRRSRSTTRSALVLGKHEAFAIVAEHGVSASARSAVISYLRSKQGMTALEAEILTWKEPAGLAQGLDWPRAEAIEKDLRKLGVAGRRVKTSQVLSWRFDLSARQQERLATRGELTHDQKVYPRDSVCHCYHCGHEWVTRASRLDTLPSKCTRCKKPWFIFRMFRCTICGHQFAHSDLRRPAGDLFSRCPACQSTSWHPQQQIRFRTRAYQAPAGKVPAGSPYSVTVRLALLPAGAPFSGRAQAHEPWLQVSPDVLKGNQVTLHAETGSLAPKQTYTGHVDVIGNAGHARIEVRVHVDEPPKLQVDTVRLDFGEVRATESCTLNLTVDNVGGWTLQGSISGPAWLRLSAITFQGKRSRIQCTVDGRDLPTAGVNTGELKVDSNGGQAVIPVTGVALPTTLSVEPPVLDFGRQAKNSVSRRRLLIQNQGIGLLEGQIVAGEPWIEVDAASFSANRMEVIVAIDTQGLMPGEKYQGSLTVTSNGGDVTLPVTIEVTRYNRFIHTIRYDSRVRMVLLFLLMVLLPGLWATTYLRTHPLRTSALPGATVVAVTQTPVRSDQAGPALASRETPTATRTPATVAGPVLSRSPLVPTHSGPTRVPTRTMVVSAPGSTPSVAPARTSSPTSGPTVSPTPTVTPSPTAEQPAILVRPTPVPVCPDERSIFTVPRPNQVLRGIVTLQGTAMHEQFQYYKIEYAVGPDASGDFAYLTGGDQPVVDGALADWWTFTVPNGTYTLRLTVVDRSGNYPPPCQVTVRVAN